MRSISGLVAFVTGGASGLGKATCERFIKHGAKVVVADLPSSLGEDVAKELGENAVFAPLNVTKEEDIKKAFALTKSSFGCLNAVVNCAGIAVAQKAYNFTKKEGCNFDGFKRVQEVNVNGTYNVMRHACSFFAENSPDEFNQRGIIINTASIAAYDGQMGQTAYAASKGAIVALTLPMARDVAAWGIRVNTIAPGVFHTPMMEQLPDKVKKFLGDIVLCPSRLGDPDWYAALAQHMVENPYINAEVVRLDGGIRMPP